MMSLKSKRELREVLRARYLKANKVEKQKMLDEFTLATGYHRKHAIRVLKSKEQSQNRLKRKTKTYKAAYSRTQRYFCESQSAAHDLVSPTQSR